MGRNGVCSFDCASVKTIAGINDERIHFFLLQDRIERIGELKRPLSAKFIGAKVECAGNVFRITMKPFFAKSLASSAEDITLVKGAIAEIEGIPHSQLVLQIKEKSDGPALNFSNELESF